MLEHGGGILAAAAQYGIPAGDWLDLSTGLNPHGWPVPAIDPAAWLRLPEASDGLEDAAMDFYGGPRPLPVAGSQAAIQILPALRAPCRVGLLELTYAEHPHAWSRHGHHVKRLAPEAIDDSLDTLDVLQLCTPNNPTGWHPPRATLLDWHERLRARGGWLLLDEAFMDADPARGLVTATGKEGLIVLRSVGKFFGLAGARAGFVFAWPALLAALADALGPWTLTGPSRQAVRLALRDPRWHATMRARLPQESARLADCLSRHGLAPDGGTALFQWLRHDRAAEARAHLARQGVLVRSFDAPPSLRFGLPADEAGWARLDTALRGIPPAKSEAEASR
jgi:cobalamin biosynthesis protein CobC